MPLAPLRPCAYPRCPALVRSGRCAAHGGTGDTPKSWARPSAVAALRMRGRAWMALRGVVMAEECQCYQCGQMGQPDDIVDHLVPLAEGGTDDRHNLARCCRRCHHVKTGRESARARR